MNNNNQMSFNPITNQPLNNDNKTPNIKKEQETNEYNLQQIPYEYNPYKQPYSIYQGRP